MKIPMLSATLCFLSWLLGIYLSHIDENSTTKQGGGGGGGGGGHRISVGHHHAAVIPVVVVVGLFHLQINFICR